MSRKKLFAASSPNFSANGDAVCQSSGCSVSQSSRPLIYESVRLWDSEVAQTASLSDCITDQLADGMSMHALKDLVTVMEEEIRVAEELLHNLASQREAVLSWDSSALLEKVEERETAIRKLGVLEERRQEIMTHLLCARVGKTLSLSELLAQLPPAPEIVVLNRLQRRTLEVYGRLRIEEKRLVTLMENLLGHLREALVPLAYPPVHLYGKMGGSTYLRPESGLIAGKA